MANEGFGYVRVSTIEEASNGESRDTQQAKITGYSA
ncbi:hypothetical protein X741_08210 [Mesorhizobium sp. LNHC229A00]|nr:hypothetical protein X741_08210 [Mesorhizobium sp. LNHC229A00]